MATRGRERDLELLIPVAAVSENGGDSKSSSPPNSPPPTTSHSHHQTGHELWLIRFHIDRSWASKKFMTGCVILLPIAITFYITWAFIKFVDGLFSPIYNHLGINIFVVVGNFCSYSMGVVYYEMPLISYIYAASKQISTAISPDQSINAFKEVAIIRHPRIGEYALGFITSTVVLDQRNVGEELCCVYVPTNHLYLGDIFLISPNDILRPNLSVGEGIEIVISGGLSIPQLLTTVDAQVLTPRRAPHFEELQQKLSNSNKVLQRKFRGSNAAGSDREWREEHHSITLKCSEKSL
ncbi:hypothetical protein C1H46_042152 [Malus baccata]|uniref:Protein LIKE COV 3 n=1 Tax=Malus baccata TaxID=106549 RepID=A0A540KDK3_MALBA|nr:hypothetical protein C1H46_042152 [Malus baccata]